MSDQPPEIPSSYTPPDRQTGPAPDQTQQTPVPQQSTPDEIRNRRRLWLGVIVLIVGLVFLAQEIWGTTWDWDRLWPVILIAVGIAVIFGGRRR